MGVAFLRGPCRGVGGNESLAGYLHRGCHNIHWDPSGWPKPAWRDRAGSGSERLCAAMPEASAGPGTALGAELGSVPRPASGPSLTAKAKIGDDSIETKSVGLGDCHFYPHHDAAQPVPTTRDASDEASNPAPVTQDFRYLSYYVWSELPPTEKPADIVLSSLKDTPVGTPVEEIKRASDAVGLDFNFMKAVARIESGFDPKQRTGSYIGLFQLSEYEFNKFG